MSSNAAEYQFLNKVFDDLFPICRSISGPGLEQSIAYFSQFMPLTMTKVASGTEVFDWTVPPEWHFQRARLWGPDGKLICDSQVSNLHVVNYSEPIEAEMTLEQLQPHLHSIPHLADAIPYVTSYYHRTWGFCLSQQQRERLTAGVYKVKIDSHFDEQGGVPYAQTLLAGESEREILLSSYLCHPSLANNELSGPLVLLGLYRRMQQWPRRRFSYRFLLNPETIGSLCFLSQHHQHLQQHLEAGLILTCLGGPATNLRYKASKRGNSLFDRYIGKLAATGDWRMESFTPLYGSDERQYCAPGFNLPMGQVAKTVYGVFPQYHNSLDDKAFMDMGSVIDSIDQLEQLLLSTEISGKALNLKPYGEPQLGKRGLYPNINTPINRHTSSDQLLDGRQELNAILTVLSESDGKTFMLDIADKLKLPLASLRGVIEKLEQHQLIRFNTGKTL
ncbi:hypothetical protein HR45_10780 [Shewanella mangrovi]|uniref:Aminopeptidase n=1 Tax=Shewanella mangrovi TaxID=1515746 RepID=A0A094JE32_9GAMM|nr:DUF4910 domain-containing protein [Shewanella mangrovi]KFZ37487.1 hypothetical protein HR45_10780 [Shewanella mangrovi]